MTGILGGSFDPIHNGHLQIARQALARVPLDQLQFMPSAIPVHRDQAYSSPRHRLNMIEMVVSEARGLAVNTTELDRQGPSYTVESLREISARSETVLVLVMGADAFNSFASWKMPEEILSLSHLLVCRRPGIKINTRIFPHNWVDSVQQLSASSAGAILKLEIDECDCSSTAVRQSLVAGEVCSDCLNPKVSEYINLHNLYRSISD
jgi:nicotinate-nucleotide adenylyltransferase